MTQTTVQPAQAAPPAVTYLVNLCSGKAVTVLSQQEKDWFEESRDAYLHQTAFTENTDLKDMDRLLAHELMIFRWTQQLFAGVDHTGDMIDEERIRKNIKEFSDQINKIKTAMGLTKQARDDAANSGNFATWLADVKARAKIFGIHREKQLTKALALFNELSTLVGTFDRSDEEERRKIGLESEHDILQWIRHTCLPEYRALDDYFRAHHQRYWVRDL